MRRFAAFALLLLTTAARADRIADFTPEVRAAIADMCVLGTVTEIEKEPVQAKPFPSSTDPIPYTVAVVKVETNVHGAKNITFVRVGFIPQPGGMKFRYQAPTLAVDQKVCLFLNKLPDTTIYVMPSMSPPVENSEANKAIIDSVKKLAPAFANPLTALKAEKADDRAFAAGALLTRYRQARFGVAMTDEAISAEESKAILAALAGADWTQRGPFSPPQVLGFLNLTKAVGYNPPQPKPGQDAAILMRDEFKRWVENEGAKYAIKKQVPKAK